MPLYNFFMGNIIKVQKGCKDILPENVTTWQFIEEQAREVFSRAGFRELRTPIFEATELFQRGVGDTTDIVNKEMYTFEKSDRSITLRPENTAGVVRAYIENGMHKLPTPVKLYYMGPMFRYERPQAGRQRQFSQVGVEMFGIDNPLADAEVIALAVDYLKAVGLNDLDVEINSIGCPTCRTEYKNRIKEVLKDELSNLCEDCQQRYEKNPLRLLDCKVESCKKIFEKPEIQKVIQSDYICGECSEHFEQLKSYLDKLNISYKINKLLVRGLDYYNRTVFEIKSNNLGTQNAVCGGGRYDTLVGNLGGQPTPAIGFAMGMERLISLIPPVEAPKLDVFVVSDNMTNALYCTQKIREMGFSAEFDLNGRKFSKQLEKASKVAKFAVFYCENEVQKNVVNIKNLSLSTQKEVSFDELGNILHNER